MPQTEPTLKTQQSSTNQAASNTVVVKALKESIPRRLAADGNMLVWVDGTFEVGIIFVYCSFQEYKKIYNLIFRGKDTPQSEANGYTTFGTSVNMGVVALVWINNRDEKSTTIPTMVHEMSHVADDIVDHVGIVDKSGEARAYILTSHARKILEKFYGIGCQRSVSEEMIMEAMS